MFGDKNVGAEVADRTCSLAGCGRKYVARGYCGMHYQRWSTTGQLGPADLINKPAKGLVCQVDGCCKEVKAKGFAVLTTGGGVPTVIPVLRLLRHASVRRSV
jgi:hypothetical protein